MTTTESTWSHRSYKQVWGNWQEAKRQIAILRAQLKEFGEHKPNCASLKSEYELGCFGIGTFKRDRKCDCGWASIEKEMEK